MYCGLMTSARSSLMPQIKGDLYTNGRGAVFQIQPRHFAERRMIGRLGIGMTIQRTRLSLFWSTLEILVKTPKVQDINSVIRKLSLTRMWSSTPHRPLLRHSDNGASDKGIEASFVAAREDFSRRGVLGVLLNPLLRRCSTSIS